MRSIIITFFSFFFIFASKDKTPVKVNPTYFGQYYKSDDSKKTKEWTLKPMAKAENKIAFYHNMDTDFVFYVVMKDSTHFGTKGQFAQQLDGQPTRNWTAHGEFLPDGQMKIAVSSTDAGLKLTVNLEAQEKVLYTKK